MKLRCLYEGFRLSPDRGQDRVKAAEIEAAARYFQELTSNPSEYVPSQTRGTIAGIKGSFLQIVTDSLAEQRENDYIINQLDGLNQVLAEAGSITGEALERMAALKHDIITYYHRYTLFGGRHIGPQI